MALAKYFDKNALAASQVLQGYDKQAFEERLNKVTVEIAFDKEAVEKKESLATLDMLVRLLSRLYPSLKFTGLTKGTKNGANRFSKLALSINDRITLQDDGEADVTIVVGITSVVRENPIFYIGSSGWLSKLSVTLPVGSSDTNNPFAAGFAACLAAANVFRLVFNDQLINGHSDDDLCISLVDFTHRDMSETSGEALPDINLAETFLIGLGAIGNGSIWALSKLALNGKLYLIDPEKIDESNLQRYVLTTLNDVDRDKADLAMEQFSGIPDVHGHSGEWASFMAGRDNWKLPFALVAVDSAKDRIGVQATLPERLLNAWTQPTDLGVSRHLSFGEDPCLSCLYPARKTRQSESELIAGSLGLLHLERELIRPMVYNNSPISRELLTHISTAKSVPLEDLLPHEGKPIREFYHQVICGGMITVTEGNRHTDTPMAFQSAMAGILLASELVVTVLKLRTDPIATMTRLNLLKPLAGMYDDPLLRDSATNCLCNDHDFLVVYDEKYSSS